MTYLPSSSLAHIALFSLTYHLMDTLPIIIYSPLQFLTVPQDNNTALHIAADIGRVAIVQVLIDRNANINALGKVRTHLTRRRLMYHRYILHTPMIYGHSLSVGCGASIYLDSFDLTYHAIYISLPS